MNGRYIHLWVTFLVCLGIEHSRETAGAEIDLINPARIQWKNSRGEFAVEASLVSQTETEVLLEDNSGKKILVEKRKIDPKLIYPLHAVWLRQQDEAQYLELKGLLGQFNSQGQTGSFGSVETYLQLHRKFKTAPYAGIVAALALSMEKNDIRTAAVVLRDVTDRLAKHRVFDANAHRLTLATALNNLAVCFLKDGKGSAAAANLQNALEIADAERIPAPLLENVRTVLNIDPKNPVISINERQIAALGESAAKEVLPNLPSNQIAYPKYCLVWDLPWHNLSSQNNASAPTGGSAGNDYVGLGSCFGIVIGNDWAIADTRSITRGFVDQSSVVVRAYRLDSNPAAAITASRLVASPDETSLNVTLLGIPAGFGKPLALSGVSPSKGSEVMTLQESSGSLSNGPLSLARTTVSFDVAKVTEPDLKPVLAYEIDMNIPPNLGGGPVLDAFGNVVGLAASNPFSFYSAARGLVVPAGPIRDWAEGSFANASLLPFNAATEVIRQEELSTNLVKSVLKIDVWGDIERLPGAFGVINKTDVNTNYADHWCIRCRGAGFVRCVNKSCKLGRIFNKVREVVDVEPRTNTPIYAERVFYTECEVCTGVGKLDCPACDAGKY